MALVDVDRLSHGRGDGEGDARADLEGRVDLIFISMCCSSDWDKDVPFHRKDS